MVSEIDIHAIILLHESGLPIYRIFISKEEITIEPLLAAILGLAKEMRLGDIAYARFKDLSIIIFRGLKEPKIILTLLADRIDHINYLRGIYLMNKIERELEGIGDIVTSETRKKARNVIQKYIKKIERIPDFLGECFEYASESLGEIFIRTLPILLYKKFNEDPLNVFIRSPLKFIEELNRILGETGVEQLLSIMLKCFSKKYYYPIEANGNEDLLRILRNILETIKEDRGRVIISMHKMFEKIIDSLTSQK